ncbi:MAG: hypothetical protein GY865_01615, partial [candidate division Zixibacteria bacterium]|nr:hypothetical protein [candidate division Zixibacteria bacterium]
MKRKFVQGLYLSLLLTFFMILSAGTAFGMNQTENEKQKQKIDLLLKDQDRRIPLDLQKSIPPNGIDGDLRCGTPPMADEPNWDYDYSKFTDDQRGVISPGAGAGMTIGFTTYDLQHYGRCTRQIAWRNTQDIHITWMHKNSSNPTICYGYRGTVYQAWDATTGTIKWDPYITFGGDQLHASGERSGYPGIDAMSDGRALVYNHYDQIGIEPYTYLPTIWPDNPPLSGTWGWKQSVSSFPVEWNDSEALWPYAAFQLYDNGSVEDTIIHILARESNIES